MSKIGKKVRLNPKNMVYRMEEADRYLTSDSLLFARRIKRGVKALRILSK
jgi:hypothetical protein